MYDFLSKKYPSQMNSVKGVSSKDIIYLCRDALSDHCEDKIQAEKELLGLIKSHEWNWYARDIDSNIILTYPVFNSAFSIVEYLIENNKYNVKEYNPTLAKALGASVRLKSAKMMDLFLKFDLNDKYKNDLIIKAYNVAANVKNEEAKSEYIELAEKLIEMTSFIEVVDGIISSTDADCFHHYLFNHPLSHDKKLEITRKIMENYSKFWPLGSNMESKNKMLEKFEVFAKLQDLNVNTNKVKKIKI